MSDVAQVVTVRIAETGADSEELAGLADALRGQLLELDVRDVRSVTGEAPEGTRAVGVAEIGTLLVTLGRSGLLGAIVSTLRSWLGARADRSIKIEMDGDTLEITRATQEQQRQLIDAWVARHAGT